MLGNTEEDEEAARVGVDTKSDDVAVTELIVVDPLLLSLVVEVLVVGELSIVDPLLSSLVIEVLVVVIWLLLLLAIVLLENEPLIVGLAGAILLPSFPSCSDMQLSMQTGSAT